MNFFIQRYFQCKLQMAVLKGAGKVSDHLIPAVQRQKRALKKEILSTIMVAKFKKLV